MTQFELFCAVYYAVGLVWLNTGGRQYYESGFKDDSIQNEDLRMFLSDANPHIWAGENSADPAIFTEFREIVQQKNIPIEDSYGTASRYIEALPYYYADGVREAFMKITRWEWDGGVARYMSKPHKGGGNS